MSVYQPKTIVQQNIRLFSHSVKVNFNIVFFQMITLSVERFQIDAVHIIDSIGETGKKSIDKGFLTLQLTKKNEKSMMKKIIMNKQQIVKLEKIFLNSRQLKSSENLNLPKNSLNSSIVGELPISRLVRELSGILTLFKPLLITRIAENLKNWIFPRKVMISVLLKRQKELNITQVNK